MIRLLTTVSWQEFRHHPWRSGTAVLAVALGVALALAVQLINASALAEFRGEHDFRSFQNVGTELESTVREVLDAELIVHENSAAALPWMPGPDHRGQLIEIRLRGTGFLKQMVRNIAGTLVEVGRGRVAPGEIRGMLEAKDRRSSGMTAPPHGLFLDNVEY